MARLINFLLFDERMFCLSEAGNRPSDAHFFACVESLRFIVSVGCVPVLASEISIRVSQFSKMVLILRSCCAKKVHKNWLFLFGLRFALLLYHLFLSFNLRSMTYEQCTFGRMGNRFGSH